MTIKGRRVLHAEKRGRDVVTVFETSVNIVIFGVTEVRVLGRIESISEISPRDIFSRRRIPCRMCRPEVEP